MKEKGLYFLDLFGGKGSVSKALHRLGFSTFLWDTAYGNEYDLMDRRNQRFILQQLRSGKVVGVMLHTLCTSWSHARHRTNVIRTALHPWGNPTPPKPLSANDARSLLVGNNTMRFPCRSSDSAAV